MQLCRHMNIRTPRCRESWEINAKARLCLLGAGREDRPDHVFGNVLSVFPQHAVAKMHRLQRRLAREHKSCVRNGERHNQFLRARGETLLMALDATLLGLKPESTSWCYRHSRHCTIPQAPDNALTIHAAGSTCTDWSSRSVKAMRWLGCHMVPFLAWAHARQWRQELVVLHECVMAHPSEYLLRRYLGRTHYIFCFPFCPSILGHPTTRRRRLTLAIRKSILRASLTPSPAEMFKFAMVADGQLYFAAAKYELNGFLASCGASSFLSTLPAGALQRPLKQMF